MKFDCETTTILYGCNDDGTQVTLQEGDEVYLKLDLAHMDLYDKEEWIQKYPDGWVKGIIWGISPSGRKIEFKVDSCVYFSLVQKNIIAVSDKAPN